MRTSKKLLLLLTVVVITFGGACGGASDVRVNSAPAASGKAVPDDFGKGERDDPATLSTAQVLHLDWSPAPNFQAFVDWSDAAVTGRVTAIAPARWNTRDNREPTGSTGLRFRDATVFVDTVVYDSAKLPVKAGQELTVRLYGDDTDTGPEVGGAGPVKKYNKITGPVAVGDEVLWVLATIKFGMNDGTTDDVVKLVTDFFGAWRIDRGAGQAKNAEPARTVPVEALVGRLRAERQSPSDPGSNGKRGKVNPLE